MNCTRNITQDIVWVGGSDRRLSLFENIFPITRGVSYNAYLIKDEMTVLLDTADASIRNQFLENLTYELNGRALDILVVNHMEPDHCAMIEELIGRYPEIKIVGNQKTFSIMKQFFGFDVDAHAMEIKEEDVLNTGHHTLQFIMAPMVHWPEAMVTFDREEGILFSADAFGSFGALDGGIFNDEIEFDRDWLDDARRYYTNIVGKYGASVQALLRKASKLPIKMICPLHGPIWRSDLPYLLEKYGKWSTYEPETEDICILYASMYGNTESAANALACRLADRGANRVRVYDLSGTDPSELISQIFKCRKLVFAAPTYNGGIYPKMEYLLNDMKALNVQKRTVAILENGTWAPASGRLMKEKLSEMKDMTILEPTITIRSSLKSDQSQQLDDLVKALLD